VNFFGEPWPSGICDEGGVQVETPVGEKCLHCSEPIELGQQGSFIFDGSRILRGGGMVQQPVHRECSLRAVIGGIGHLEDHHYWCQHQHDPDGGRTYRQSALEVWAWVMHHGIS
jgi:hypothetical protein